MSFIPQLEKKGDFQIISSYKGTQIVKTKLKKNNRVLKGEHK